MAVTELDTFVKKFMQLWKSGHSAHLDIDTHAGEAWVGLRVRLGSAPGPLHQEPHHQVNAKSRSRNGPARQRRRARRSANRLNEAVEASEGVENASVEEETSKEAANATNSAVSDIAEEAELAMKVVEIGIAEEATTDVVGKEVLGMHLNDEVCKNEVYELEPVSICSVEIFPKKYNCLTGLEPFRAKIEDYFENRKDVIKKVIKCEIVNHGNNVRLVVEVNTRRGWIFFFCDPEANYKDLYEDCIRTVRHSCLDLSNCDKG